MAWKKELPEFKGIHKTQGMARIQKAAEHEQDCRTFIYDNLNVFVETSNDLDQLLHKVARINPTLGFEWVDQFINNLPKFSKEWEALYSEKKHYNDATHKRDVDGNNQRKRWEAISQPYWQRRYDLFQKYGQDNTHDILFEERMIIKMKGWDALCNVHYSKEEWLIRNDGRMPVVDYDTGKIIMKKV